MLLKLYVYGYLNRVQSSRRLEREAGRNLELLWLLSRLVPDHKTIADFRKDNGLGLRQVCARFVELCRELGLLATASVAIDGSKFKSVNNRDRNFTKGKVERRRAQLEESIARYLSQLETADRQEPTEALAGIISFSEPYGVSRIWPFLPPGSSSTMWAWMDVPAFYRTGIVPTSPRRAQSRDR